MNKNIKNYVTENLQQVALSCLVFVFLLMVLLFEGSMNAKLSLGFTSIASLATIGTLIIALKLYDRFGIKGLIKRRVAELLFELDEILRNEIFIANGTRAKFLINFDAPKLRQMQKLTYLINEGNKKILVKHKSFENFHEKINPIRTHKLLPNEIYEAMNFLVVFATAEGNYDLENYIKVDFSGSKVDGEYQLAIPDQTLSQLIANIIVLIETIEKWMKDNSGTSLSFTPKY